MKKILSFYNKYEYLIFVIITLIAASHVFIFYVFPTLDGPHHLYTSNIIIGLLENNPLVESYFKFNSLPVSNILGHGLLAFYNYLLPSPIALNLLVFTYIAGMAFSFRYLMITISGRFSPVNYGIFPLITNSSLVLGLFNFCLGLILFFLVFAYWIKIYKNLRIPQLLILGLLLVMMIFMHVLSFTLFGISIIIFLVYDFLADYIKDGRFRFKLLLLRAVKLALIAIPSFIILYFYYLSIRYNLDNAVHISKDNVSLFENLYFVRPLIIYQVTRDGMANIPFFIGFVVLALSYIGLMIFGEKGVGRNTYYSNLILILTLLFLVLTLAVPPGFLLGTIKLRLSLVFFLFLVMWLGTLKFPAWLELIAALFFLFIFTDHQFRMGPERSKHSVNAYDLHKLADLMEPNSVYLAINEGTVWPDEHITSYIGSEKILIDLNNPQAYGPFTIKWNYDDLPFTLLGGHNAYKTNISYLSGHKTHEVREIDYILIYHYMNFEKNRENPEYASFFEILDNKFERIGESDRKRTALYKHMNE